ncbi:hypothetical protein C8A01DRAFT_34874 [Parachaetomium inaequale]|uniref:Uncharacterized protein n=1 Tax=Parachaetomium inaequale TaxID=2588326 RepID=A0AAN6PI88_9PEZI|nr:hypothetical protein C8A01DRAFT_34874 [Parachaetomium inaequale]
MAYMYTTSKEAWVARLTETMPLTALDHTAPQNYILRCFGFPFCPSPRNLNRHAAIAYLKWRLVRAFSLLPFLEGQIIHGWDGELPRLVYPGNVLPSKLDLFSYEVFDYQVFESSRFPWSFEELSALGVPAETMAKDLFWLLPKTGPAPSDACHPITLRASFIDGGLILGFAFHHGVMDGTGTVDFLNYFATDTYNGIGTLWGCKQNFIAFAAETARTTPVDPRFMPGYDFTPERSPPTLPPAIAKVLTISAPRAAALQAAAQTHLRAAHGPRAFASTTDVLCALTWLHVTRARLLAGRIAPTDTTPLRDSRNLWLRALASSTVGDLVQDISHSGKVTTEQIAEAAWCIRQAVMEMDDPATFRAHLAIAARASSDEDEGIAWPEVGAAVSRAMARHSTGLDASVHIGLGADVEFEIRGVRGGKRKAVWVRRAYVPNDGAMNLLPRIGGTKGEADWQVWLALREEDMRVMEEQGELGAWLSRPAA